MGLFYAETQTSGTSRIFFKLEHEEVYEDFRWLIGEEAETRNERRPFVTGIPTGEYTVSCFAKRKEGSDCMAEKGKIDTFIRTFKVFWNLESTKMLGKYLFAPVSSPKDTFTLEFKQDPIEYWEYHWYGTPTGRKPIYNWWRDTIPPIRGKGGRWLGTSIVRMIDYDIFETDIREVENLVVTFDSTTRNARLTIPFAKDGNGTCWELEVYNGTKL